MPSDSSIPIDELVRNGLILDPSYLAAVRRDDQALPFDSPEDFGTKDLIIAPGVVDFLRPLMTGKNVFNPAQRLRLVSRNPWGTANGMAQLFKGNESFFVDKGIESEQLVEFDEVYHFVSKELYGTYGLVGIRIPTEEFWISQHTGLPILAVGESRPPILDVFAGLAEKVQGKVASLEERYSDWKKNWIRSRILKSTLNATPSILSIYLIHAGVGPAAAIPNVFTVAIAYLNGG